MNLAHTQIDAVLDALTQRVRLLSLSQVSRLIGSDEEVAERLVGELASAGIVSLEPHVVSEVGVAEAPLCSLHAGESVLDFGRVAYELRNRWTEQHEVDLILPCAKACQQYGGTRVRPRASEWSHDLWMSEVYLCSRGSLDADTDWVSGDTLRSDGEAYLFSDRVPDACLRRSEGAITKVVEGGGASYGRKKLSQMARDFSSFAFEIW